jgi:hypothetical protein
MFPFKAIGSRIPSLRKPHAPSLHHTKSALAAMQHGAVLTLTFKKRGAGRSWVLSDGTRVTAGVAARLVNLPQIMADAQPQSFRHVHFTEPSSREKIYAPSR